MRRNDGAECGGGCRLVVSVGVMVSGWNGGRNQRASLNTTFKAEQKLSFWGGGKESEKSSLAKYTPQCDLLIYRRKGECFLVLEKDVTERNHDTDKGRSWA